LFALLADFIPQEAQGIIGDARNTLEALGNEAKNLEGQTGITKLNSRQVFSGLPPIKIPITMYFRAWANAQDEVERPINQLFEWALPQELADESAYLYRVGYDSTCCSRDNHLACTVQLHPINNNCRHNLPLMFFR